MTGKFVAYRLAVCTFFFILLISISFFLYMGINERVHDICYDVAETVSTKGLISEEIFTYIKSNLSLYGEYELNFILEKHLEENTSVFYYGEEQIKNIPLNPLATTLSVISFIILAFAEAKSNLVCPGF